MDSRAARPLVKGWIDEAANAVMVLPVDAQAGRDAPRRSA